MAKQEINIGVEGNDGTGDAIREAFRKVNENFNELYAIFGLGGTIGFTSLRDTPDTLLGNGGKVVLVKPDQTGLEFYDLVSGGGNNDPENPLNTISFTIVEGQLIVESINTKLSSDPTPTVANPLRVGAPTAYTSVIQNLLTSGSGINDLVAEWNAVHQGSGAPITADNLLISKGYADQNYVNSNGDTMTGPLVVPAGATGNQVPRTNEVVSIDGDTMTGPLYLHDHPGNLSGAGLINDITDLQAATKRYVDYHDFVSSVNLYVNTKGTDDHTLTPPGKAGRNQVYAFKTIAAACARAERIQEASEIDLGPYIQTITYNSGANNSLVNTVTGYTIFNSQQTDIAAFLASISEDIADDVIDYISSEYPDFVYDEDTCRRDLGILIESVRLDLLASTASVQHNYLSRYAGFRYFANPSSEFAISVLGQYTETVDAITYAKNQIMTRINVDLGINSGYWYSIVDNRFDDILAILDTGAPDPELIESSNYYRILIDSGLGSQTDQSNANNPDLIPGKIIRGKTSKAIGRIIEYKRGIDLIGTPNSDRIDLQLLTPLTFVAGEELEFANRVNKKQITILVESGIYEEQLPIRVPADVSIMGDEFRRVVIRPATGVSTSPWARTWFYRDASIDGLTTATGGEPSYDKDNNLVGYYGYHYLSDPSNPDSTPLRNDQMDVFLMNDNTVLRNITCQRHGGFMMVFDPVGQILTRSPYCQTATSFSKSVNKKAFHGGMFIDGYVGNMPVEIVSKTSNFELVVEADSTSGLGIRKPLTPSSFFIDGIRYQINSVKDYDADDNGTARITLILDETSNDSLGYADAVVTNVPITIQTAGNRSMLANDYTQINDLGYGVIATNNALAELVSVFTYYAHTGYYALNGSQIRSLTGNNSYGTFGMVSEGSDPDEIARVVTVSEDMVQPVKIYSVAQELIFSGDLTGTLVDGDRIYQIQSGGAEIEAFIAFSSYDAGDDETTVFLEKNTGNFLNTFDVLDDTSTIIGTPLSVIFRNFQASEGRPAFYIFDTTNYPLNASELEILHNSGLFQPYDVISISDTGLTIPADKEVDLTDSSNSLIRRKIWRLDLSSGVETSASLIQELTDFGTFGILRSKQNILFDGLDDTVLARPSTALVFDEQPAVVYRTIGLENTIVSGIPTAIGQTRIVTDTNFDYVSLLVDNTRAAYSANTYNVLWTGTLGSTIGDEHIAISPLSTIDSSRIIGMIFTWDGVVFTVTDYEEFADGPNTFAIISIEDEYSINSSYVSPGLSRRVDNLTGDNNNLQAGLVSGSEANITVNISTCRATSHDFLDIGTGGYNTTNYPDRIYGAPITSAVTDGEAIDENGTNSKAQVQERFKGRCFFSSTDQDGFFRVGRFFTVDQGTGRVTFNAAIVLTNIDGIGFRQGVRVTEFSPDSSFTNARGDSVPTQTATEGYINRRLGWDRDGDFISPSELIGGGAVRKTGDSMSGVLDMSNNKITGLPDPTNDLDASNKQYVDDRVATYDELSELLDVDISTPANAELLVYDDVQDKWVNAGVSTNPLESTVSFTFTGGTLRGNLVTGSVTNTDISASAAIAQSKLNLNSATTRANATGISQGDLGVASFDSATFTSTSGWVSITNGAIGNSKLTNSSITIGSTNIALGATSTALAGLTSVAATTFTGALTGNASTATTATNVSVTARNSDAGVHYISFVTGTSGNLSHFTDTGLTYVPSTDTLSLGSNFSANGSTGAVSMLGNLLPGNNNPTDSGQNIGALANRWNTVYATTFNGVATEALYADLAEKYLADFNYESGTVLIFGGSQEVTTTSIKGDRRIAGVVSTNPAYLMNSGLEGEHVTSVALTGRVPCKVLGRVNKGDLLVTSAIPGYAIVDNDPKVGTVIGKSVGIKDTDGKGIVEIVVGKV